MILPSLRSMSKPSNYPARSRQQVRPACNEAIYSSKMSVIYWITWRRIPEKITLYSHQCENLKSRTVYKIVFRKIHSRKRGRMERSANQQHISCVKLQFNQMYLQKLFSCHAVYPYNVNKSIIIVWGNPPQRNNRRIVGSGVFYVVRSQVI
jgi:hypothetical protein